MFQGATAWILRYDPPTAGSVDGPASAWSVKPCAANKYVSSNACAACPAGTLRNAGDNPDGADTACTTCAADYYVSAGGVCTACATGLFRLAGDVSTGGSPTACTYASPFASKAELVNTIASSYCLGGSDATGATCTDGKGVAIASWDVSSVVDMAGLFQDTGVGSTTFNANIGSWATGNVQDMSNMFKGQAAFNQNIGSWATGSVIDMNNMFNGAAAFNQDISSWDTSAVTDMSDMFQQRRGEF